MGSQVKGEVASSSGALQQTLTHPSEKITIEPRMLEGMLTMQAFKKALCGIGIRLKLLPQILLHSVLHPLTPSTMDLTTGTVLTEANRRKRRN